MADRFAELTARHQRFIETQQLYFVATAAPTGHVNVSPKGLDSLRILGPRRVLWANGTGSGNETAAHVRLDPRLTLMFCSFDREPSILRVYGQARAVHQGDDGWDELSAQFPGFLGLRNVFEVDVEFVTTSCGYGVPEYTFKDQRALMPTWAAKKGPEGLHQYQQDKNVLSLDGFPTGLPGGGERE